MLLKVKNINKYYNEKHVLKNVSFEIERGEIYVLVGESGCGKSPTAKILSGLIDKNDGEVIFNNKSMCQKGARTSKKIQMVFQDPNSSLNPMKNIKWILEEPFKFIRLKIKKLFQIKF